MKKMIRKGSAPCSAAEHIFETKQNIMIYIHKDEEQ